MQRFDRRTSFSQTITPWPLGGSACAAIDRHRLDDQRPYLYITRDYGKSCTLPVDGVATSHFVNDVREDTQQPNLLFAGTTTMKIQPVCHPAPA